MLYMGNFIRKEWQPHFYKNHSAYVTFSKIYGLTYYDHRFSFSLSKIRKGINPSALALCEYIFIQSELSKCKFMKHCNNSWGLDVCLYVHIDTKKCMCPFRWTCFVCAQAYLISPMHTTALSRRMNSVISFECYSFSLT